MTQLSTGIQINPSTGAAIPRQDWVVDTDAVTRIDFKLTEVDPAKDIDLTPVGKRIDFLYISAATAEVNENTTITATLAKGAKDDADVAVDLRGFPVVLGGGSVSLLGSRRKVNVTIGGDKKDVDVVILIGREA